MFTSSSVDVCRYTYYDEEHDTFVLLSARKRGNSKTTGVHEAPMIDTTIFSYDQVVFNDFQMDKKNCGDCPRSYNTGPGGLGCYTHGGRERLALERMLNDTHLSNEEGLISTFSDAAFDKWTRMATTDANGRICYVYNFLRHGRYGDPAFMSMDVMFRLNSWVRSQSPTAVIVGYTHQSHLVRMLPAMRFLQVSAETIDDVRRAIGSGQRVYFAQKPAAIAAMRDEFPSQRFAMCPASKQARVKQKTPVSCYDCGGCSGTDVDRPHYFIHNH